MFPNSQISTQNLRIFGDKERLLLLTDEDEGANLVLEYWDGDICRRIWRNESEDFTSVYFEQNEDFAVYTELYKGKITTLYKKLSCEDWHEISSAPEIYAFLTEQWRIFQRQFSDMIFYRQKFNALITPEKLREILALPLVKDRYSDYYSNDGEARVWGDYAWRFRQESDDESPRIQITLQEYLCTEATITFFHFQLDEPTDKVVKLYTQDGNGYEVGAYEVEVNRTDFYAKAIKAFETLNRHIFRLNSKYLQEI